MDIFVRAHVFGPKEGREYRGGEAACTVEKPWRGLSQDPDAICVFHENAVEPREGAARCVVCGATEAPS